MKMSFNTGLVRADNSGLAEIHEHMEGYHKRDNLPSSSASTRLRVVTVISLGATFTEPSSLSPEPIPSSLSESDAILKSSSPSPVRFGLPVGNWGFLGA